MTDTAPLAPSAVASPRDPNPPHEMSVAEIRMIVDAFATSAVNFQAAGYDGVEISAGHGYLVAQFLSRASNLRSDAYRGDTLEGRTRLCCVRSPRRSAAAAAPAIPSVSASAPSRRRRTG